MRPMSIRTLTPGEQVLAQEVFAGAIDAARVWVLAIPAWGRAFVPGGRLMVWPAPAARTDFADPATPLDDQATFVHELTHVWQAQCGVLLLPAKLRAGDSAASYAYDLAAGPAFPALNIEQQAMVVEHAFRLSRGGAAPHPAELYARASLHWRGGSAMPLW
jgi:hypothetical protein